MRTAELESSHRHQDFSHLWEARPENMAKISSRFLMLCWRKQLPLSPFVSPTTLAYNLFSTSAPFLLRLKGTRDPTWSKKLRQISVLNLVSNQAKSDIVSPKLDTDFLHSQLRWKAQIPVRLLKVGLIILSEAPDEATSGRRMPERVVIYLV